MSRGGYRRESDSSGWGGFAAALGLGAAAVAGAIYIGKKVYDEYQEEKKREEKLSYSDSKEEGACGFSDTNPWRTKKKAEDDKDHSGYPSYKAARKPVEIQSHADRRTSNPSSEAHSDLESPLHDALNEYYDSYVNVSHHKMSTAQNVLDYVKDHVLTYLQGNRELGVRRLVDTGSAAEGLKVINPDEFDVEIHLDLKSDVLEIKEDENVPGYVLLKFTDHTAPYDGFRSTSTSDDGLNYFSPEKIRRYFQGKIQEALRGIDRYTIQGPSMSSSSSVKAKVEFNGSSVYINFVPAVFIGSHHLVAHTHPNCERKGDVHYENFWRLSYSQRERGVVSSLQANLCHKKVLKIMKAIRENHPSQLGMFQSYVFKTILLYMIDDTFPEEWGEDQLPERFIDFIKRFEEYLWHKRLPHCFINELNLFDDIPPSELENAKLFLQKKISKGTLETLLKKNKPKN